jgi:hypothetical protein
VGHRGPPAMSAAASGERDELADSLAELFTNVSLMVRGELQVRSPPPPPRLCIHGRPNRRPEPVVSRWSRLHGGPS